MTSASELFYSRRFRFARNPEPALRSPSADADRDRERDRDREHCHLHDQRPSRRQHRRRLPQHDCGSPRYLFHGGLPHAARHLCDRGPQTLYQENDIVGHDFNGASESSLGNNSNSEISSRNRRLRLTTNDRLPGAVLQARARLLERLRGISLTGSRLVQNTSSSGISWDEFAVSDDFRVIDSGDWETDTPEGLESGSSFFDPTSRDWKGKKPPGLTQEAIDTLQREVFKELGDSSGVLKASLECCICLDKFLEGDSLIHLACGHRFHPECLNPWVQTCGDCPYCRSRIVVDPALKKRL